MRQRVHKILNFFAVVLTAASVLGVTAVYADDFPGNREQYPSNTVTCNDNFRAFTRSCGNNGGGADWRVYLTEEGSSSYSNPVYLGAIMSGGINGSTIAANCPASEYKWYAAYGAESKNFGTHYGPLQYLNSGYMYNNYGNILDNEADLRAMLARGEGNGSRLTQSLTEQMHENIPFSSLDTGYFCIPDSYFATTMVKSDVSISAAGENASSSTGIVPDGTADATLQKAVSVGETVTIKFDHTGYSSDLSDEDVYQLGLERLYYVEDSEYGWYANPATNYGGFYTPSRVSEQSPNSGGYMVNDAGVTEDDYFKMTPLNSSGTDLHDEYELVFKQPGTYAFCEKFNVDGSTKIWACAHLSVRDKAEFYAQSNVGASTSSSSEGFKSTSITSGTETVWADNVRVAVGGTAYIRFSHNIYSDAPNESARWLVTRSGLSSTGRYTVNRTYTATSDNPANFGDIEEEGYYLPKDRKGTDGKWQYVARDVYKVQFLANSQGVYTFCETIYINSLQRTTSCVKITVTTGDVPPPGDDDIPDGSLCRQTGTGWMPASYTNSSTYVGTTSVVSRIINKSLTRRDSSAGYANWRGVVDEGTDPQKANQAAYADARITYAKPGDTIRWVNCYYPGVQKVANTLRTYTHGAHGNSNTANTNYIESNWHFGNWENKYTIRSETNSSNTFGGAVPSAQLNLGTGNSAIQSSGNSYTVKLTGDVGKYFQETITSGSPVYVNLTNEGIHSWSCRCNQCTCSCGYRCSYPCCCTCRHTNNYIRKNSRIEGPVISGGARVEVPYNFINRAEFNISDDMVYAGDTIGVSDAKVIVGRRYNDVTRAEYTTQVHQAEARLVAYVASSSAEEQSRSMDDSGAGAWKTPTGSGGDNVCGYLPYKQCMEVKKYNDGTTTLNPNGALNENDGDTGYIHQGDDLKFDRDYDVFDASAGDYMCFVIAVFPWRSGPEGDTNADKTTNAAGDSRWLITAPKCAQIAKKPSVQILGGNLFTNGGISTSVSKKHNLYNIVPYGPFNAVTSYYGSWVEEAAIANGFVKNFASGAALGKTSRSGSGGYGAASSNSSYCKYWVPLSFANYSTDVAGICRDGADGSSGKAQISAPATMDRTALVDYLATGAVVDSGSDSFGAYNVISSNTGKVIRFTAGSGLTVSGNVDVNTTRVVKDSGNLTISDDVIYNDSGFSGMNELPKAVLYASGNIYIGCNVSRVDAILIAGGAVYSCSHYSAGSGDMNAAARSLKQLTINGAVIANRVELGRTYGNAVGSYSGVPAEVINYDTSALVWGRSMADAGESDTLTTVYVHELAPRY